MRTRDDGFALESPFLDAEMFTGNPGRGAVARAASPRLTSPFVDAFVPAAEADAPPAAADEAEDEGFDVVAELDDDESGMFEGLAPAVSGSVLRTRIDDYFDLANAEYTVNGSTVRALPQFRYAKAGGNEEAKSRLQKILKASFESRHPRAIHNAVYGRATPKEIQAITQALVDAGELKAIADAHPGVGDADLVRKLQREFHFGIDCAGYVQLAFIHAFMGKDRDTATIRRQLGLHERRGWEKLASLPSTHFKKLPVTDAKTGDLLILKPRAADADRAWHTVIIVEHTTSGTEHTFEADASWGVDLYGEKAGGVGRRKLVHDTATGEWWDIHPINGTEANRNTTGPYAGHTVHGLFRAKQQAARRAAKELSSDDEELESPFVEAEDEEPGAVDDAGELELEFDGVDDYEAADEEEAGAARTPIVARILWPALGFPAVVAPRSKGADDPRVSAPTRSICLLVLSNKRYLGKEDVARYLRIVPWASRTRRSVPAAPETAFSASELYVRNDDRGRVLERPQKDALSDAIVFGDDRGGRNGIVVSLARRVREFYRKQGLEHLHEIRVSETASARLADGQYHLLWNSEAAAGNAVSDEMRLLIDRFAKERRKSLGPEWQKELAFLIDEYKYDYGALHPPYDRTDSQKRFTEVLHPVIVRRRTGSLKIGHLTDSHVDVRADVYEENLKRKGQPVSFNNFNTSFIEAYDDLKKNADVILMTGDLIDYGRGHVGLALGGKYREALGRDDAYHEDRNWFLFYYLLASGDRYEQPCYTILGNHDWRLNPYPPFAPGAPDPKALVHNYKSFDSDELKTILKAAHGPGHERAFAYTLSAESTVGLVFKSPAAAGRGIAGKLDTKGSPVQTNTDSVIWYLLLINPFLDYAFALPDGQKVLMLDWAEDEEVLNADEPRTFMGFGQRAANSLTTLQKWHVNEFAALPGKAKIIGMHAPPLGPYPEWSDQELAAGTKTYAAGTDSRARKPDGTITKLQSHTIFAIRPKDAPFGVAADYGSFLKERIWFLRRVGDTRTGIRLVLSGHVHRNGLLVAYVTGTDRKAMVIRTVEHSQVRSIRPPAVAVRPKTAAAPPKAYPPPLYVNTTSAGPRGNQYAPAHVAVQPGYAIVTLAADGMIENVSVRQLIAKAAPVRKTREVVEAEEPVWVESFDPYAEPAELEAVAEVDSDDYAMT